MSSESTEITVYDSAVVGKVGISIDDPTFEIVKPVATCLKDCVYGDRVLNVVT